MPFDIIFTGKLYGHPEYVEERHRHRYEVQTQIKGYRETMEENIWTPMKLLLQYFPLWAFKTNNFDDSAPYLGHHKSHTIGRELVSSPGEPRAGTEFWRERNAFCWPGCWWSEDGNSGVERLAFQNLLPGFITPLGALACVADKNHHSEKRRQTVLTISKYQLLQILQWGK